MRLLWNYFAITFSALLPLINPLGSALIFLSLVGDAPIAVYRKLAWRIALNTIIFFAVVDLIGSAMLRFFGISLPIVQLAGGFVISALGWSLLNQKDAGPSAEKTQAAEQAQAKANLEDVSGTLLQNAFYPFTFPLTAGPGCIVVTLTLTAHMPQRPIVSALVAHAGLMIAVVLLATIVYFSYAYAPKIARSISPSTAHGILRVVAFILVCIGVQIAWNGLQTLLLTVLQHP
jgi:multiple antibiotic resistance protein